VIEEYKPNLCKRVISGVSLDIKAEDICEETGAMKAIRLNRIEKDQKIPSNSVLLIFEKDQLPDHTSIDFTPYHVREYIPTPTRCVKCNAYGHVVKHCRGNETCSKCSGGHSYESCRKKDNPKCISCNGPHSAA